jgi:hypothetical protein
VKAKDIGWKALTNKSEGMVYGTAYWKGEEQMELNNLEGDDSRIIMDRVIPFIEKSANNSIRHFLLPSGFTHHIYRLSAIRNIAICIRICRIENSCIIGTITAMEEQMGRLWDHLQKLGIDENTMIWFCSDNGPEDRTPGSAGIFRERKRSLYEGGVRVPAFVLWKAKFRRGEKTDYPMVTSDYLPTIIDFLNIEYPVARPLDGISLRGALINDDIERNNEIGFLFRKKISWVSDRYKLVSTDLGETFELYDLLEDETEKTILYP